MLAFLRATALLVALTGCARHSGTEVNFTRPNPANTVLGVTTDAEVLATYGQPTRRSTDSVAVPGRASEPAKTIVKTVLSFNYGESLIGSIFKPKFKDAVFIFWDGKLVSFVYESSFPEDSTSFDINKAAVALADKQITRDRLIVVLGEPSGRAIAPLVKPPATERLVYLNLDTSRGLQAVAVKMCSVEFDSSGHLVTYSLKDESANLLVPASTSASTAIPISVPARP